MTNGCRTLPLTQTHKDDDDDDDDNDDDDGADDDDDDPVWDSFGLQKLCQLSFEKVGAWLTP